MVQEKGGNYAKIYEEINQKHNEDWVDRSETNTNCASLAYILEKPDSKLLRFNLNGTDNQNLTCIVACENLQGIMTREDKIKNLYLLLANSEGKPLSTRRQDISLASSAEGKKLIVNGYITTIVKGKQYTTLADTIFMEALQAMANNYDIEVEWRVSNANKDALDELEPGTPEHTAKLREQAAWLHLYDEGGKFGMNRITRGNGELEYIKTFKPQEQIQEPPHTIETKNTTFTVQEERGKTEEEAKQLKQSSAATAKKARAFIKD